MGVSQKFDYLLNQVKRIRYISVVVERRGQEEGF
jgi:hypothetical protein